MENISAWTIKPGTTLARAARSPAVHGRSRGRLCGMEDSGGKEADDGSGGWNLQAGIPNRVARE
ncbi:MAG: hypothetical protein RLZZ398_245 [Verrucomicrobiota bacterium]|jgi:hypothetical protein